MMKPKELQGKLAAKLKINPLLLLIKGGKAMQQYRKLYQEFCNSCKKKVMENPMRDVSDYCSKCQELAKIRMQKVSQLIGVKLK